jgi:pimeloyl-ACP methyl ester carboxylesterase
VFTEQKIVGGAVSLNLAAGPANGPPLLLLHGVTRRWQDFLTLAPALASRWHVHALDFRGHGQSGRAGRYRVIDYVSDVLGFLDRQTDPTVIYGHSLGALVAAAVAAKAPHAVRALVLEDPPAPSLVQHFRATPYHAIFSGMRSLAGTGRSVPELAQALADIRLSSDGPTLRMGDVRDATSLRFTARCLCDMHAEVLMPLVEGGWLDGYDAEGIFAAIRCPVLLLRADERAGGMLPANAASQLAARIPDCTRIDLPGIGHLLHWLATEAVIRHTIGFLESL